VPANPPVVRFWSFTLYGNITRGPVVTDQGAAAVSSRQNLAANTDGSVDLYFGPAEAGAQAQNWVKVIPGRVPLLCPNGGVLRQDLAAQRQSFTLMAPAVAGSSELCERGLPFRVMSVV
jgi:Protein of unknown function (DUF1214)